MLTVTSTILSAQDTCPAYVKYTWHDSTFIINRTNCKGIFLIAFKNPDSSDVIILRDINSSVSSFTHNFKTTHFLNISGNILYDYNYRSYIDTPLAIKDFQQHYVQANLRFLFAEKYPFDFVLRSRQSNNSYFRNFTDVNVFYNGSLFKAIAKKKLLNSIEEHYSKAEEVKQYKKRFIDQSDKLATLNEWVNNENRYSSYLEYKEWIRTQNTVAQVENKIEQSVETYISQIQFKRMQVPSMNNSEEAIEEKMMVKSSEEIKKYVQEYDEKLAKLDSLKREVVELKEKYEKTKSEVELELKEAKNKINSASSYEELKKTAGKFGLNADSLSRSFKFLYNLKAMGFGRSFIDYSELTVKNVSINGLHLEYQSNYYFAVATGTVDYRFRDFVLNTNSLRTNPQNLGLIRIGKKLNDRLSIILTAYAGHKNSFVLSDSSSNNRSIYGFSIEAAYQLNRDNFLIAEMAKSSIGVNRNLQPMVSERKLNIFDNTTSALFLKGQTFIRKTKTKLRGSFRYQGGGFQSFTLYYTQNNITSWNVLADQPLWKNRIVLQGGIRANEFTTPYSVVNYKSNVIFKSIQASVRIKHLPFVTVAYMPSSQLSIINSEIIENRFYSFMCSASHFYRLGKIQATSLVMYSRYYNDQTDSGFVYYNARNINLSQTFMGDHLITTASFSRSANQSYKFYTYDLGLTYTKQVFSFGAGAKYNELNSSTRRVGYYTSGGYSFSKFKVDINFSYEHGFLPGINHSLMNNDFGRVTILKRL